MIKDLLSEQNIGKVYKFETSGVTFYGEIIKKEEVRPKGVVITEIASKLILIDNPHDIDVHSPVMFLYEPYELSIFSKSQIEEINYSSIFIKDTPDTLYDKFNLPKYKSDVVVFIYEKFSNCQFPVIGIENRNLEFVELRSGTPHACSFKSNSYQCRILSQKEVDLVFNNMVEDFYKFTYECKSLKDKCSILNLLSSIPSIGNRRIMSLI